MPRRGGSGKRTRPRPLSDYGQLAIRSFSIPEDSIAMESQKTDCVDGERLSGLASVESTVQSSTGGYQRGRKRRPISVIGGVSFYGSSQTEEIEGLLTQVRYKTCSLPTTKEPSASLRLSPARQ